MKNNEWGKTLLSVYKYLETITCAIDKMVKQEALNSFYFVGHNQARNSVDAVADRIIALSERKVRLINTKVLVDQSLLKCKKVSAQLLIEKYMDNDPSEVIAQRHNLHIRTYFRKIADAEEELSSIMASQGFDDKRLNDYLGCEHWIMEVYQNFKSKKYKDDFQIELEA